MNSHDASETAPVRDGQKFLGVARALRFSATLPQLAIEKTRYRPKDLILDFRNRNQIYIEGVRHTQDLAMWHCALPVAVPGTGHGRLFGI